MKQCALLIVDLQNDFMPEGPLGVKRAHDIVPIINALMPQFSCVIASRDWHPENHVSFANSHPGMRVGDHIHVSGIEQILWPVHCVQNTTGADFVPALKKEYISHQIYKGTDATIDSYSAFFDNKKLRSTGLREYLEERKIPCIVLAGLTTDYCVLYTVKDACDLGLQTYVLRDACRAVNMHPDDEKKAFREMEKRGAILIESLDLLRN